MIKDGEDALLGFTWWLLRHHEKSRQVANWVSLCNEFTLACCCLVASVLTAAPLQLFTHFNCSLVTTGITCDAREAWWLALLSWPLLGITIWISVEHKLAGGMLLCWNSQFTSLLLVPLRTWYCLLQSQARQVH